MAGAIAFSIGYVGRLIAALFEGKLLTGPVVRDALDIGVTCGTIVFFLAFILAMNANHNARSERKKLCRKLTERPSQSDEAFCRHVPDVDRNLTLRLRWQLAENLNVPHEKILSTDKLDADLKSSDLLETLYTAALGGCTVYEVCTDDVLDIIDKSDRTVPQAAEEIRLLTEWTSRQREQQADDKPDKNRSVV